MTGISSCVKIEQKQKHLSNKLLLIRNITTKQRPAELQYRAKIFEQMIKVAGK